MTTPRLQTYKPRPGLTLIEILVTISLIAGMLGMLLPALSSATGAARQAVCASNIRQIQFANELFANDHRRYIPGAVGIRDANLHRWHGVRASTAEPFLPDNAPITPYLEDGATSVRARACPEFAPVLAALEETGAGFESGAGGYGYNNTFVGVVRSPAPGGVWTVERDDLGARNDRFTRPASTIAFADAAFADRRGVNNLIEYSFAEPNFWPDFPGARPNPSIHFRHAGAGNVAWLDGHVSAEQRSRTYAGFGFGVDSAAVGLGWFGADDSNTLFGEP